MRLTVIVTVFNEKNTILKAIEEAKGLNLDKEVIVIDNCSTDGTREILRSLNDSSINIIYQPQNYGYGQSVKTGIAIAKGEFVYMQYSDLEYDIDSVYQMIDLAEKDQLDAVFGSRLYNLNKDMVSYWHLIKERPFVLATILTTFLTNLFYNRRFTDIIGTKFYRTSSFKGLQIESTGVPFDFEVVSRMCKKNYKIKEIPVSYRARTAKEGKKVKAIDFLPSLIKVLQVKFFD